jgi:uncharacterized tellurite resistance protein B-like protein
MAANPQVLESLAFLFFTFGQTTDGTLAPEEMRALAAKLREWAPEAELAQLGELLKATVVTYKNTPDKLGHARELTNGLRSQLDAEQLAKVVSDLEAIAEADGNVSAEERAFIEDTRKMLA